MKSIFIVAMLGTTLSQSYSQLLASTSDSTISQGSVVMDCQLIRNGSDIYDEFSSMVLESDINMDNVSLHTEYYETDQKNTMCKSQNQSISCKWTKWLGFGVYRYQLDLDLNQKFEYPGPDKEAYAYSYAGQIEAWLIRPCSVICHVRK